MTYTKDLDPSSDKRKPRLLEELSPERIAAIEKEDEENMREFQKLLDFRSQTSLSKRDAETKTWNSFQITSPELEAIARKIKAWDPDCSYGLFVHGAPGGGKTHMMKALIQDHYSETHTFKFMSVSDLMSKFKDFDHKEYYHTQFMKPFGLVLDDLGTEKASEYEQNELFRLLEHRKEVGKHVFMTSNLSISQLREKYNPRIISRLGELMVFVECKVPSHRTIINQNNQKDLSKRMELVK